ncbi:hypothetical protein DUNSADRAFT_17535 [Dunaliella salina]|uniref:Encoded protein n=1 Tax=Dunaliella salina TaxID=3046 RepID=A0ABQ7H004_DUNSA|nr:hypothetical protein DUNSADRAFT_17535 [Dunaliella salina]|eukprot:KAF5840188.1 hypothetical protein DUNSADRAFT_17535 [Dunaliella salina]
MISLAANARAHGNSSLNSACNAALRALKQGPHSGVLLATEEDEEDEEEEEEEEKKGKRSPLPAPDPYVNRYKAGWLHASKALKLRAKYKAGWLHAMGALKLQGVRQNTARTVPDLSS